MFRRAVTIYAAAAALAIGAPSLSAQERPQPGSQSSGERPNPGGGSTGSAVSRPGGGGGAGSSAAGGTSSSAGSSSSGSSSRGGMSSPSGDRGGGFRSAPDRPERRPENRAVPRDNMRSGSSSDQRRVGSPAASAPSGDNSEGRRRAVPAYSRPRDGRPTIGSATERRYPAPRPGEGGYGTIYDPYYRYGYYYGRYPGNYYWPGYGFGVGYFYDPWMWGSSYYDPYYYGGGGGGYSTYRRGAYRPVGSLRLKVNPKEGQVFVDGYYVGEVDSFDGIFQKLTIEEGAHRVEIRAPGFEPVQFEVMVIPGETVTYKGELKRIQ